MPVISGNIEFQKQTGSVASGNISTGGGACRLLDPEQITAVKKALAQGPAAHGFTGGVWTLARIARVIAEVTGVVYHTSSGVWKLLHRMGWSHQMPSPQARERDEDALASWMGQDWPRIKGRPRRPAPGSSSPTNPDCR